MNHGDTRDKKAKEPEFIIWNTIVPQFCKSRLQNFWILELAMLEQSPIKLFAVCLPHPKSFKIQRDRFNWLFWTLGEGFKPPKCTKKAKKNNGWRFCPSKPPGSGGASAVLSRNPELGLKCTNLWHKYKCGPVLETLNFFLQTFVLQLNHTYVPRKQKGAGIQAEPRGMCSKVSANINRKYLFICSSCLSRALAAIIKRNFKHSQLLISYLLIPMFIFSHPFQLRLITLL